jgi:hypothetical protein
VIFFHLVFAISRPVSSFCCWHKHMSSVYISLLMKLAVLKLVLKTKQILLPLQLWRSTSAWTQSCGMPVPARLFPCPQWVAWLCTSLRATASRLVHNLSLFVKLKPPIYPLAVFSRLEKFSLFYTSFWWISAAGSSINKQGNGVSDPQLS